MARPKAINESQLALNVSAREGGKKSVSIAQIREVVKCTIDELANGGYTPSQILALIEKHVN